MKPSDVETVQFVWCDDWMGIYINGVLLEENHSLDVHRIMEKLGFNILPSLELTEDDMEELGYSLPKDFVDIGAKLG